MENKTINIKLVAEVANALKELLPQMVFVGGATISLYTDDISADDIRPTGDIDMAIQLSGFAEWAKIQERLSQLGFNPYPEGHAICSYLYKKISVDIMPAEDGPIGKSNSWYKPGFDYLKKVTIENEEIKILSAPYFLATKFEAFRDRGSDYRTSHDFEDIIYVIDNRTTIVEEILAADDTVKSYLKNELSKIISNQYSEEIIKAHIHPLIVAERYPQVMEKIKNILS